MVKGSAFAQRSALRFNRPMPACTDPERLRAILDRDRVWGLYPLGDLEPHLWPHCQWWCNERAVLLLYRRFEIPILVAFGPADAVRALLDELPPVEKLHLHVRPEVLILIARRYDVPKPVTMIRMHLDTAIRPPSDERIARLTAADVPDLENLYRDGDVTDEGPDFFAAEMVGDGIYFGIREDGALIAVAGTHLLAPTASAAAIGNVYTRRDRRGRGLGAATTSAVITALHAAGFRTIGLSVKAQNAAAIHVYERLGFREHCRFIEGRAERR